jgi:hypothetical protein
MLAWDFNGNLIGEWDIGGLAFDTREVAFENETDFLYFINCSRKWKRKLNIKTPKTYPCLYKYNWITDEYEKIY